MGLPRSANSAFQSPAKAIFREESRRTYCDTEVLMVRRWTEKDTHPIPGMILDQKSPPSLDIVGCQEYCGSQGKGPLTLRELTQTLCGIRKLPSHSNSVFTLASGSGPARHGFRNRARKRCWPAFTLLIRYELLCVSRRFVSVR